MAAASPLVDTLFHHRTLLEALAAAPADRPFVTYWAPDRGPDGETATFGEFTRRAEGFAALYRHRGVRLRDTVVIVMPQGIEVMAAFAGALIAGAIPTLLAYPTFKIDPEKYRHGLSGVTRILKARLIVLDASFPAELIGQISLGGETEILQARPHEISDRASAEPWARPDPDDVAFIQHSAGTTGLQKGVALSHRPVLLQLAHLAEAMSLRADDRIVSWLPLYHDMGLIACFILPMAAHLHVVMESPTDWVLRPGSLLDLASRHGGTVCWLPNFAFQFMARRVPAEDRARLDLSRMRAMVNCSEPVRPRSMDEFHEAYAPCGLSRSALQASYAMAENTFAVTQTMPSAAGGTGVMWLDRDALWKQGQAVPRPAEDPDAVALGSSGPCIPGNAVRIVGTGGQDLSAGRVGEILVRSDSLFAGYYNRPELTREALRDGWYRTKDFGFVLDGEVYVIGRKDDTIIVAGKNIYPQDVEEIAFRHAAVRDGRAVAFGIDNPDLGTQDLVVVAELSREEDLQNGLEIEAEIRREIVGELGVAPRYVHLVPPKWIIKSTAGKPARSTTRERFLRERSGNDESAR